MLRKLADLVYFVPGRLWSPFTVTESAISAGILPATRVTNGEILLKFCFSLDLFETWGLDDICIMGY